MMQPVGTDGLLAIDNSAHFERAVSHCASLAEHCQCSATESCGCRWSADSKGMIAEFISYFDARHTTAEPCSTAITRPHMMAASSSQQQQFGG